MQFQDPEDPEERKKKHKESEVGDFTQRIMFVLKTSLKWHSHGHQPV